MPEQLKMHQNKMELNQTDMACTAYSGIKTMSVYCIKRKGRPHNLTSTNLYSL